ncbi:basic proline-rich protein-like [Mugil cephalus]|uniref:basic proline-rich protein-like n=1 Tax=Mugil cephalus TaxID=48193 RepID=UPI001FB7AE47|nr:basic proline-rich protein-like [Mugil cephalus]
MGRGKAPTRGRPPVGPPLEDGPPFDMGWGPPPPGGWGPPPPEAWGPPPPGGWGPPPPGGWGPPPPGGWGPSPPSYWRPPSPGAWGPPSPDGWPPPPEGWDLRGPPPPDWHPRALPPPGWGPYPDDWPLPPEDWGRHPDHWRPPHPDPWRRPPEGWGPPGWGPDGRPDPWGPEPGPPVPIPPPPVGVPPPAGVPPPDPSAFGPMALPPVPPPGCVPPFGFPACPPPDWTGEPVVEEPMLNPPPEQPEWIKALISAPATESTPGETKSSEEVGVSKAPAAESLAAPPPPPAPPKPKPAKTHKALGLLGKRTFDKPPPGRSTGIISFIGPSFGYIEREDLEKFTFTFNAFFGNPKAMTPGVRVHFTGCKQKDSAIATDVKVAPGGTENVDPESRAVITTTAGQSASPPGERQYPGQVYVNIGPLRTNLTYDRRDSSVTLLKNDQVLINLLTDIVTEKRRATNIRPQIPATFSHTKEAREKVRSPHIL